MNVKTSVILSMMLTFELSAAGHYGKQLNQNMSLASSETFEIVYELNDLQQKDLLFMLEEEKLAGDVYTTLYEYWGTPVFSNIATSERTHFEKIANVLNKYDVEIPSMSLGQFTIDELQSLYDELVYQGTLSIEDAYKVGVTIEKKDIEDLKLKIDSASPDAQIVYQNLLVGSYNHLHSFESLLESNTTLPTIQYSFHQYKLHKRMSKNIQKGWSMLALPFSTDIKPCEILPLESEGSRIFTYIDGSWQYTTLQLDENDTLTQDSNLSIPPLVGFWIYTDNAFDIEYSLPAE